MENKIKHLEMIQEVIQRMAHNSFQLKGWAVTLIGVVGALCGAQDDKRFFLLAFIPALAFWGLDAFYLQVERKYTVLFKNVTQIKEEEVDFNMDTRRINVPEEDKKRIKFLNCVKSKTEIWFYGSITLSILILSFVVFWSN